jgi:hypothetical protein
MDEFDVLQSGDIPKRLADKEAVRRLLQLIEEEAGRHDSEEFRATPQLDAVLASRRIDLSGYVECHHYDCVRSRIESTYPRLWHYFDQLVIEGIPLESAEGLRRRGLVAELVGRLEQEIRVLIYLREVGAVPFIIFAEKPAFCRDHFNSEAESAHVYSALNESDKKKGIKAILGNSNITIEPKGGNSWQVSVDGPLYAEPWQSFGITGQDKPSKRDIAELIFQKFSIPLVTDLAAARKFKLPLAETINTTWLMKGRPQPNVSRTEVILELDLPVLDGLNLKDFLKLREDESESFEQYRTALREAIDRQLSAWQDESPAQIAKSVTAEFIRPGLANIEHRMRTSRRAMIKKSALNIAVGSSSVMIGSLDSLPLITSAGVAAIAASIAYVNKNIDDRSDISLSSCYFLWKAQKLVGGAK